MHLVWRKQRGGDFDHEAVWGTLALIGLLASRFFPFDRIGLTCWLHRLTGIPCPSCGGTRAFVAMAHGHFVQGFLLNPLAAVAFVLILVAVPYCIAVVLLRKPRLRLTAVSSRDHATLVASVAGLIAVNWTYLIVVGR